MTRVIKGMSFETTDTSPTHALAVVSLFEQRNLLGLSVKFVQIIDDLISLMDNHVVICAVDFTVTVPEVIPSLNGSDADSVYLGGPGV